MAKAMRILAVAVGPKKDQIIRANGRLAGVRPYVRGLIDGLAGLKRRIGTDFEIEYRQHLPHHLADGSSAIGAFRAKPGTEIDLIFAMSTTVVRASTGVTRSTPIVFPSVSDFKADKIARDGNATGVSARRSQTAGDCFVRFLATVPTIKEVRVLHKQGYPPSDRALQLVKEAAKRADVKVTPVDVQSIQDIRGKLSAMPKRDLKAPPSIGILVLPVDVCLGAAPLIIQLAQGKKKLPTFFPITDFVHRQLPSALGGYGVSQRKCGELAAKHVDQILWGKVKAGTLKVTEAEEDAFEWVVSAGAAKALNIKLPRTV